MVVWRQDQALRHAAGRQESPPAQLVPEDDLRSSRSTHQQRLYEDVLAEYQPAHGVEPCCGHREPSSEELPPPRALIPTHGMSTAVARLRATGPILERRPSQRRPSNEDGD